MRLSSTLAVVFLAATSALASPPACLLASLTTNLKSPDDIKATCNQAKDLQAALPSHCPTTDQQTAAYSAYQSVCSSAGVSVPTWTPSSKSSTISTSSASGSSASSTSSSTSSGSSAASGSANNGKANSAASGVTVGGSMAGSLMGGVGVAVLGGAMLLL